MKSPLTKEEAQDVLNYLVKTRQAFCFMPDGRFITREDCQDVLAED